ncbi:LOW QUALITY PROTEIN: Golgi-associated RAB2 interactor protein 5B [Ochotona princeps]|uniref:LOW QUALITY PROTEIN: Golgi-associated RAB2 interactor protein 5B n=1 Tax=Ochotona princeps TaxID=9978 RepID=UPI0027151B5E|nr:LOW QUALITY PROTEIN: Golgi-associated RAB2 interactor protein 5B [Ochotona princeps]
MKRLRNIRRMELPQGSPKWVPVLGELQKTLQRGEYLPLRPLPMFESNFVQVTNRGSPVFLHHRTNRLTMGVAASLPGLVQPDILLIAQPPQGRDCVNLVLTRMIPLDLVHLYVHDLSAWRLKLRLVTGRYYYLELDAPDSEVDFLFDRWIRLINLLREPVTTWAPRTLHTPPLDMSLGSAPASTWHLQQQCYGGHAVAVPGPMFPYKMPTSQKQKKAKALKRRFKSQAVGDSVPLIWSQLERADFQKKSSEKKWARVWRKGQHHHPHHLQHHFQHDEPFTILAKGQLGPKGAGGEARGGGLDSWVPTRCLPVPPRTPQAGTADSEGASEQHRLLDTPSRCVVGASTTFPFPGAYNHLDMLLWQQDLEDLMDPESSTLSSSSLGTAPGVPPGPPSCTRPSERTGPGSAWKGQSPSLSQKAASVPLTPWKAPFLVDQSHKVPAIPAPRPKAPAALPPRAPAPLWKVPPIPNMSHKTSTSIRPAASQKAPAASLPHRRSPHRFPPHRAPAVRRGVVPKLLAIPTPKAPPSAVVSQKAVTSPSQTSNPTFPAPPAPKTSAVPPPWGKPPDSDDHHKDRDLLPAGVPGRELLEMDQPEGRAQPAVLVGVQLTDVVEMRAQATSLELPYTTTKKESQEVLVTKTREIALEGLQGKGKCEDRAHKVKEKRVLELPGMRSKEVEQQRRWVKTTELAVEGPRPAEHSRPFSVEGLALAKLMIMAGSKDQHQRPAVVTLPSWLSMTSQPSALPFSSSQMSPMEATPMAPMLAREQPELHTWGMECATQRRMDSEASWHPGRPFKGPLHHPLSTPNSPKLAASSQVPIALPASRWEDLPEPHAPTRTGTSMAKSPQQQQPLRRPRDHTRAPRPHPLARMTSSSEILPMLLEIEKMRGMETTKAEVPKEELHLPPSTKHSPHFE